MSRKKIIWLIVAALLVVPAILDAVRYLKPDAENKQTVKPEARFPARSATELILVYNAWGGIYPGIADVINKEFFPKSYPCNLCYQTFGTFGMKEEWRTFIDSLPYQITELHKDDFQRRYEPENLPLPAILISDGRHVRVLTSAEELNRQKSLQQIIDLTRNKLKN